MCFVLHDIVSMGHVFDQLPEWDVVGDEARSKQFGSQARPLRSGKGEKSSSVASP